MKLILSIFELQTFRNFITSDEGIFLRGLEANFDVKILTSSSLAPTISKTLSSGPLFNPRIEIHIAPNMLPSSYSFRVLISLLRWSTDSPSTLYSIRKSKKGFSLTIWMKILYLKITSRFDSWKHFLRALFLLRVKLSRKIKKVVPLLPEGEVLLITSITNLVPESLIGAAYKLRGTMIVGTPRSWDNMHSHGTLPLVPDIFLCHSTYMEITIKNIQAFKNCEVVKLVAPNYRHEIRSQIQSRPPNSIKSVLYACMGTHLNPDEPHLIEFITEYLAPSFPNINFYILQHPYFLNRYPSLTLPNVTIKVFPHDGTNLVEYYNFLASMDRVYGIGTSVILDSAFCQVNCKIIAFECIPQSYWKSAQRYLDTLSHSRDYIEASKLHKINSKAEFIEDIEQLNELTDDFSLTSQFFGDESVDFTESVVNLIFKRRERI